MDYAVHDHFPAQHGIVAQTLPLSNHNGRISNTIFKKNESWDIWGDERPCTIANRLRLPIKTYTNSYNETDSDLEIKSGSVGFDTGMQL